MKRREFITLLGGAAITAPFGARAQQPNDTPHIGIIDDVFAPLWDHFRQGLRDLGYVDGRNIVIDSRSAQSDFDQLRQAAREFASMKVNVNRRVRLNRNARCSASYVDNSNRNDWGW